MPKNIPSYVVLDTRDGHVFFRGPGNKAYDKETAHNHANLSNSVERNQPFIACKLVPEFSMD